MGRRPVNKLIKQKTQDSYRKCRYCNTNRDARGFDKHLAACKVRSAAQNENRIVHNGANTSTTPSPILTGTCDQQAPISTQIALHTNDRNAAISVPQSSVAKSKCYLFVSWNCTDVLFQPPAVLDFLTNTLKLFLTPTLLIPLQLLSLSALLGMYPERL